MRYALLFATVCLAGCFPPPRKEIPPESMAGTRLDCIPPEGTMGEGLQGWSVIVDYPTHTVNWFGMLRLDGSFGYALTVGSPAEITATTIKWKRHVKWQGNTIAETLSINRSTGTFYYEDFRGNVTTAQCERYQGPPPARF